MLKLKKGLIEVYTGTGKGKTTAAFGLAFRALGWGYRVFILQFMKLGTYGENKSAEKFSRNLEVRYVGMPYFIAWEDDIPVEDRKKVRNVRICKKGQPPEEYVELARNSFNDVYEQMISGKWDIIIMDEINVAIYYNLLKTEDLMKIINNKPDNVELVFTGRKMPDEVLERADLITEMNEVKHPYSQGVLARRGVDF
jgi:cob(I)alamin adenosyltransferase